jgi:hypothetical protein
VAARKADTIRRAVDESRVRLEAEDGRWFHDALPASEHWRFFPDFRHNTAYLDIETTGLGPGLDHITTIVLYDGRQVRHYVYGENLDEFAQDIAPYTALVTYNGKCFDVPFIEASLGVRIRAAHLDLRYLLHSLGYRGGLKGCERQLGVDRGAHGLAEVDGYTAVLLWQQHRRGHPNALQTLLAYNAEDVLNLERLAIIAYNQKLAETPFADQHAIGEPRTLPNPFEADPELLAMLRSAAGGWW